MPDAIRTHDLQSRSLTLYPAELQAHLLNCCLKIYYTILKLFLQAAKHGQGYKVIDLDAKLW